MTGFFRGPSLLAHVIILGAIEAVVVPWVWATYQSVALMLIVGVVIGAVYALAALSLASNFFKH